DTAQLPGFDQFADVEATHVNVDNSCRCSSGSNRSSGRRRNFRQTWSPILRPHRLVNRLNNDRQVLSFVMARFLLSKDNECWAPAASIRRSFKPGQETSRALKAGKALSKM